MITTVREERLLVVSDVHLGNPLYRARRPFLEFLDFAADRNFSVCINGDGVDVIQTTAGRLTRDLAACSSRFASLSQKGLRVYYVVGNHDAVLEHFLADWGPLRVVPFLNVLSGEKRIRIEHGHLYDALYMRSPRIYVAVTVLGGMALRIHPRLFRALERMNRPLTALGNFWKWLSRKDKSLPACPIPGERLAFLESAGEIAKRGFDAIVLGHTHRAGEADLGDGCRYFNTGYWLEAPQYVEIDHGAMRLKPVFGEDDAALSGTWSRARGSWARMRRVTV